MRHVARKYKTSMYKTTVYKPQSNESIERSHHVLTEYLKQWIEKHDCDKYVIYAIKTYNTSVHKGTKYTLYELVFGKHLDFRQILFYQTIRTANHAPYTRLRYLIEFSMHKQRHAKILIERKLNLSNTTTVRRTRRC